MDIKKKYEEATELMKCGEDPTYFMNKYMKIQSPLVGTLSFNLYHYQKEFIKNFLAVRLNILQKSRQVGITTLLCATVLWLSLFHMDKKIVFVVTNKNSIKSQQNKIIFMYESLPDWLKIAEIKNINHNDIVFANGSAITFITNEKDIIGISEVIDLLIFDEMAYIDDAREIFLRLFQLIATGGKVVLVSTPKTRKEDMPKGMFEEIYTSNNDFKKTHLSWNVCPTRSTAWFDSSCRNLSFGQMQQEILGLQVIEKPKQEQLKIDLQKLTKSLEESIHCLQTVLNDSINVLNNL